MKNVPSLRSFCAGAVVGVLVGSAGLAAAAFGYSGWQRFSDDFKVGYVTGFLDMALVARNLQPGGYVDEHYPLVAAKPLEWRATIDQLYKDPAQQGYVMTSMMMLASHRLVEKYGKGPTPEQRALMRFKKQMEELQARQAARGEGAGPAEATVSPDKPAVEPSHSPPLPKEERKWCRCDGTDPKEARAKRKSEAAAKDAADEAEYAKQAAAVKKGEPGAAASAPALAPAPTPKKASSAPVATAGDAAPKKGAVSAPAAAKPAAPMPASGAAH